MSTEANVSDSTSSSVPGGAPVGPRRDIFNPLISQYIDANIADLENERNRKSAEAVSASSTSAGSSDGLRSSALKGAASCFVSTFFIYVFCLSIFIL